MQVDDGLSTFPDVVPALQSLKGSLDPGLVAFSKGIRKMVGDSVEELQDSVAMIFRTGIRGPHEGASSRTPARSAYESHSAH